MDIDDAKIDDAKMLEKEESATTPAVDATSPVKKEVVIEKVIGGAWGAGAAKDSILVGLIAEQSGGAGPRMMPLQVI
jgi:hypothetical protein